eukprot:TRINITY_DN13498_c0_g1_i1.p1 TRINITY_DN13498_c0_g1~~TRINITY_DN13498_c0_g1_i1.p1  ORF type:complete len:498 (+),score=93.61 TRINITY_DN13498_c0_g1_i1:74-1495(+)
MYRDGTGPFYMKPVWSPQKGVWGYTRIIRYVILEDGGYVSMCKKYREHKETLGLVVTLKQKLAENPNVDLAVGSANVWAWVSSPLTKAQQFQAAGMERILWSAGEGYSASSINQLNDLQGILTSRYDIYSDVMNPANFPYLDGVHPDWVTEAWPDQVIIASDGQYQRGWGVQSTNGTWFFCGVVCDEYTKQYAQARIADDLATHNYRCRFIDTVTASSWNECYSPTHPLTRSTCKAHRMELLQAVKDFQLVVGSETGHEAAVPFLHYFEGMLSLGPYRIPDAGRNIMELWTTVPDYVEKFQVGEYYRLPLWELVYHDCVLAHWYWGDASNKLLPIWPKRDLFNALYGTAPMYLINDTVWDIYASQFSASYNTTIPIARKVGYAAMENHLWLTEDRTVQQSIFVDEGNYTTVTINFSETNSYTLELPDGSSVVIPPFSYYVSDQTPNTEISLQCKVVPHLVLLLSVVLLVLVSV